MTFQENLATLPAIDHLSGLDVCDETGSAIHHIPAAPGKLGSLKLYHALAVEFNGRLNAAAAERGLVLLPNMWPMPRRIRANIRISIYWCV